MIDISKIPFFPKSDEAQASGRATTDREPLFGGAEGRQPLAASDDARRGTAPRKRKDARRVRASKNAPR
jgi:hypothetical protein